MPLGVKVWVRPVSTGHVVYVSEQLLKDGALPPWKDEQ
jgi:hypothetical protein